MLSYSNPVLEESMLPFMAKEYAKSTTQSDLST